MDWTEFTIKQILVIVTFITSKPTKNISYFKSKLGLTLLNTLAEDRIFYNSKCYIKRHRFMLPTSIVWSTDGNVIMSIKILTKFA